MDITTVKHVLPPLPYDVAALEPHIDAKTMALHHDKHHAGYVDKLNKAIAPYPELEDRSASWLLLNTDQIPELARTAIRNNAGGHVNHSLFWKAMTPKSKGKPSGRLAEAIARDFGSFERFKTQFDQTGGELFGSGWVWLARSGHDGRRLVILTTIGHGNPMVQGHFPILLNDVWEHAYYLKYQNRRPEYLNGWWDIVDWDEAARRFELSDDTKSIGE
jgi:Fe-Mn family superoxide dismutase